MEITPDSSNNSVVSQHTIFSNSFQRPPTTPPCFRSVPHPDSIAPVASMCPVTCPPPPLPPQEDRSPACSFNREFNRFTHHGLFVDLKRKDPCVTCSPVQKVELSVSHKLSITHAIFLTEIPPSPPPNRERQLIHPDPLLHAYIAPSSAALYPFTPLFFPYSCPPTTRNTSLGSNFESKIYLQSLQQINGWAKGK